VAVPDRCTRTDPASLHLASLVNIAEHLHHRTGGMIGSLSHLIRGAAIDVITGDEKITKTNLDAVHLDHAAEHTTRARSTQSKRAPT
jgi:hypothetical protein